MNSRTIACIFRAFFSSDKFKLRASLSLSIEMRRACLAIIPPGMRELTRICAIATDRFVIDTDLLKGGHVPAAELRWEAIRDSWRLVIGNASDDLSTSPLVRFFCCPDYPCFRKDGSTAMHRERNNSSIAARDSTDRFSIAPRRLRARSGT